MFAGIWAMAEQTPRRKSRRCGLPEVPNLWTFSQTSETCSSCSTPAGLTTSSLGDMPSRSMGRRERLVTSTSLLEPLRTMLGDSDRAGLVSVTSVSMGDDLRSIAYAAWNYRSAFYAVTAGSEAR